MKIQSNKNNGGGLAATLALWGALFAATHPASAQTGPYSAVTNFSTNANPNGVWSYGWATALGAPFQLLTNPVVAFGPCLGWADGLSTPDYADMKKDFSSSNYQNESQINEPDTLCMDPQSQAVMVRFTAPASGAYLVAGLFRLQDTDTQAHAVSILINTKLTNFYAYTGSGQFGAQYPFSFVEGLAQGQTIDFVVSCDGNYWALGTGLQVTVTPCTTPLPAVATATVTNGFVVGATVNDPGCGYTNTPLVLIEGGGGQGATATAVVSNGMVADINITDAGVGYLSAPTIVIGFPPSFAVQPQSAAATAYGPATFSAGVSGVPASMSYQWLFNGTNIAGATASALTLSNVVPTNLGVYSVSVSNVFGSATSSNAALTMYPYLEAPFGGLETDWGYTSTLSVGAWGSGPLTYQWYDNGTAIVSATNATLTLAGIQFTNAGLYTVVVSSSLGSVTNTPEQVVVNPAGVSMGMYPGVTVSGVAGYAYIIQRTANLSDTNSWVTMANLTLTQPTELWVDTNINSTLPGNSQEFYRVLPGQ